MTVRLALVLVGALLPVVALAGCARSGRDEGADTGALAGGVTPDSVTGATAAGGGGAVTPAPVESAGTSSAGSGGASSRPPAGSGSTKRPSEPSRPAGGAPPRSSGGAPPAGRGPAAGQVDTVRGIAAVTGSTPFTQVVVRPAPDRAVTVTGALAKEVGVASGAEVWVRGRRVNERTIEVTDYEVRSVDGIPALTGRLASEGDRLVLVTDDGRRHPIPRPPEQLRVLVGARVWITGRPPTDVGSYGVLRRR